MAGSAHTAQPMAISVIICCHNSAKRLPATLSHLFAQRIPDGLQWEIVVVDNASTDSTAAIARQMYDGSGAAVPFMVVSEPKPGLSEARRKGMETARHGIFLFVDDDNSLCDSYLRRITEIFSSDEGIGMAGGLGTASVEAERPAWFDRFASCYATGPQGNGIPGPVGTELADMLYGAGMAVRREVMDRLHGAGFRSFLSDRTGTALISGGDTELCLAARLAGFRLVCCPTLTFVHHLPPNRTDWMYLRRLFFGFGRARAVIEAYEQALLGGGPPSPTRLPFWADRAIHLLAAIRPHLLLLASSKLKRHEGNGTLLTALGQAGHVYEVVRLRGEYTRIREEVLLLRDKLRDSPISR